MPNRNSSPIYRWATPFTRLRKENPLKIIKVFLLGSKVWVENYGQAIAGDTGSAIIGNRIDVLVGSKSEAMNW
jgi:3D (Asp-Asp-Asp) domain-containing protein